VTRKVFLILLALVLALSVGLVACGDGEEEEEEEETEEEFVDQPDLLHSNIACWPTDAPKDAEDIVDVNFAEALYDALHDDQGQAKFYSMIITLCQCYGGGLMDDVADKFAESGKPISMTSGSKYTEGAYSTPSTVGGKDATSTDWAEAYREVHLGKTEGGDPDLNLNPEESDAYVEAKETAVWNAPPQGTAQQKTLSNGGDIVLGGGFGGSEATSYHAILFAGDIYEYDATGNPTGTRDYQWNNIARQHQMLVSSGYPAANIMVLYGDGTVPSNVAESDYAEYVVEEGAEKKLLEDVVQNATRAKLIEAISAVGEVMNEDEQLYIFIAGHGSPDQGTDKLPVWDVLPKEFRDSSNTFAFRSLNDYPTGYLVEALESPFTSGPYIRLNVRSEGSITPNWEVVFNDCAECVNGGDNTFPEWVEEVDPVPGAAVVALRFPIDVDAVSLDEPNYVSLTNPNQYEDPIVVTEIYLSMGDIETTIKETEWVIFADPNLEAAVREAIAIPEGPIYPSDLEDLTVLPASEKDIADLTGLEYCTNLIQLGLGRNQIDDISPLANLTSLTWLSLHHNQIDDISPLANLTNLTVLSSGWNQIEDISALANLTSLTELYLRSNQISDIRPLVQNEGLGTGDEVALNENPLSPDSINIYIPQLEARGVTVDYDVPIDTD